MAFGETYPTRYGVPNSSVVPYMPDARTWAADYQTRYDQASQPVKRDYNTVVIPDWAQKPDAGMSATQQRFMSGFFKSPLDKLIDAYSKNSGVTDPALLKQARDFAIAAYKNPNGDPLTAQGMSPTADQIAALGKITNNRDFASSLFGFDTGDYPGSLKGTSFDPNAPGASYAQRHMDGRPPQTFEDYMANGDHSSQFWGAANDRHAMQNLSAERARMVPGLEAQTRASQAYSQQNGWGQTNGIMSADYSSPGFGQINGDFGQSSLGKNGGGAVMQPALPPGSVANTIWGQAPQRVRSWGI